MEPQDVCTGLGVRIPLREFQLASREKSSKVVIHSNSIMQYNKQGVHLQCQRGSWQSRGWALDQPEVCSICLAKKAYFDIKRPILRKGPLFQTQHFLSPSGLRASWSRATSVPTAPDPISPSDSGPAAAATWDSGWQFSFYTFNLLGYKHRLI